MTINLAVETKYTIKFSSAFKNSYKKIIKQGRDVNKLKQVIRQLANEKELDIKHRNHHLINNKYYKNCGECHIEPDWLLIYRYENEELILVLVDTGSHSDLFNR